MAKMTLERAQAKIADLESVVKGQEERLQKNSVERTTLTDANDKLSAQVISLQHELTEVRAAAIAPPPRSADEILAEVTNALMELPDASPLKKSVYGFMDALIENYKDGPGAPGRAALAILEAAANVNDPAYALLSLLQRQTATAMANMLKQSFKH